MEVQFMEKNHDVIDLVRVFLAVGVVVVHVISDSSGLIIQPLHMTVQVFFIISSYFFFRKFNRYYGDRIAQNQVLKAFLWRYLRLYLFWALIQAPLTVKFWLRDWAFRGYSPWRCVLDALSRLFLGSTFFASWYLMAMMLGMLFIVLLSRWLSNRWLFLIGLLSYCFCRQLSYPGLFFTPSNSFLEALLWIVIGKIIAEGHPLTLQFRGLQQNQKLAILILLGVLYYVEYYLCLTIPGLAPIKVIPPFFSTAFFLTVLDDSKQIAGAKKMRTVSTVMYCMHGAVFSVMIALGNRIGIAFDILPYDLLSCVATITICTLTAICLYALQRREGFKWISWFC